MTHNQKLCFNKSKPFSWNQDRHFWKIEGEKFISSEEKVEVEVEEF